MDEPCLLACLLACLASFGLISSSFEEMGCYPTCHFHARHIIEALGKVVITDDGLNTILCLVNFVTQICDL
jgi:hypothetical protein